MICSPGVDTDASLRDTLRDDLFSTGVDTGNDDSSGFLRGVICSPGVDTDASLRDTLRDNSFSPGVDTGNDDTSDSCGNCCGISGT